jgi:hypothetical protein
MNEQRGARRFGHQHVEAFCLMTYRNESGVEERIWNSRDGVTPFVVSLRDGSEAQHEEWRKDEYAPAHVPAVGDRIFVTATDAIMRRAQAALVDLFWDGWGDDAGPLCGPRLCDKYATKSEAVVDLMKGEQRPGQPALVEVTEEMAAVFAQRSSREETRARAVRNGMPPSGRFA